MQAVVAGLAAAVFIAAAFGDIRTRKIPNGLVLAISVLGVARLVLAGDFIEAAMTLLAAAAVLALGFALFWRGIIGGGDAKLVSGAALLVGYHDLFGFLFLMSLCGGALAVAALAHHRMVPWVETAILAVRARRWPGGWITRHPRAAAPLAAASNSGQSAMQLSVPYGVAIAAAGIITLGLQTFPPQLLL
jgi:Flp pilus assembly protein protease CpaA